MQNTQENTPQETQEQMLQRLRAELADLEAQLIKHPKHKEMVAYLKTTQITPELLVDIPLYRLVHLEIAARHENMHEAAAMLNEEIKQNLKAQRRAREAERRAREAERRAEDVKQWAMEQKRLADEAEREAREAQQWLEEVKDLQKSIEARLAAEGVELDKIDEIDE